MAVDSPSATRSPLASELLYGTRPGTENANPVARIVAERQITARERRLRRTRELLDEIEGLDHPNGRDRLKLPDDDPLPDHPRLWRLQTAVGFGDAIKGRDNLLHFVVGQRKGRTAAEAGPCELIVYDLAVFPRTQNKQPLFDLLYIGLDPDAAVHRAQQRWDQLTATSDRPGSKLPIDADSLVSHLNRHRRGW